MIKVVNEVKIHEEDGKETPIGYEYVLNIDSHWNRDDLVIVRVKNRSIAVKADDLIKAIQNAVNTGRF